MVRRLKAFMFMACGLFAPLGLLDVALLSAIYALVCNSFSRLRQPRVSLSIAPHKPSVSPSSYQVGDWFSSEPETYLEIHSILHSAPSSLEQFLVREIRNPCFLQESRLVKQRQALPSPRQAIESKQACAPERDAPRRSLGAGPW